MIGSSGFPFPGNHEDKQAARLFLYRHARTAPIQGHAVTLAGPEPASEVGLMRDYLRWPAHRVWFVDKNKSPDIAAALKKVQSLWPGANAERINVWNLAPRLEAIGFANLDFMGSPLNDSNVRCLKEVSKVLLPGAILGFTWMRGRECLDTHKGSIKLWKFGKGYRGNERRWAGVVAAMKEFSSGSLSLIDRWEYLSNHSPMSVSVFRKG